MDATIISTASAPSVTSLFTPAIASPIHNAGHMVFGPAEAFTPEQLAELYDINVLSTHSESIARCCRICGDSGRRSSSGIEQQQCGRHASLCVITTCRYGERWN